MGAALAIGGPGATFWMIMVGLFGMASKFVECTLGVKYRNDNGPLVPYPVNRYVLLRVRGMAERGMGGFGKVLAVRFALMTIFATFGAGNMFQGNQAFAVMSSTFSIPTDYSLFFGIGLAFLVGMVIIGSTASHRNRYRKSRTFYGFIVYHDECHRIGCKLQSCRRCIW